MRRCSMLKSRNREVSRNGGPPTNNNNNDDVHNERRNHQGPPGDQPSTSRNPDNAQRLQAFRNLLIANERLHGPCAGAREMPRLAIEATPRRGMRSHQSNRQPTNGSSDVAQPGHSRHLQAPHEAGRRSTACKPALADGELFRVSLKRRVFDREMNSERLAKLERDIRDEAPDMYVCPTNGRALEVNRNILGQMCGYFDAIGRSGMKELELNSVTLDIEEDHLNAIVDYVYTGKIRLAGSNVVKIYRAAHYLQMDSLLNVCDQFLSKRTRQLPEEVYKIGVTFSRDDFADAAVSTMCRFASDFEEDESRLRMGIHLFQEIISSDSLRVTSEDKACELVIKWIEAAPRTEQEVQQAVNCLRLPHITEAAEEKLTVALESQGIEVPSFALCKERKFIDLPEEMLTPRDSCPTHVHIFWEDEMERESGPVKFNTSCMRFHDRVLSNQILDSVQHRSYADNFEFVVAGDRIMKVTQNKKETRLIVDSLEANRCFKHRATFEREAPLSDFAICADGSRCVVSYFNGFSVPPKFNACDTADWRKIEDYYRTPVPDLHFSPREMSFYDDVIVIMRNQTVFIVGRADRSLTRLEIPEKKGHNKFVNFVRLGGKVYVYEDQGSGVVRRLCDDRIHVVNLETREIEDTIRVDLRVWDDHLTLVSDHTPGSVRKFVRCGEKVYIVVQDDSVSNAFFFRFKPEEKMFGPPLTIRAYDFTAGQRCQVFSRKFHMQVPAYLHRCRHESILQRYLRTVPRSGREAEIKELSTYL